MSTATRGGSAKERTNQIMPQKEPSAMKTANPPSSSFGSTEGRRLLRISSYAIADVSRHIALAGPGGPAIRGSAIYSLGGPAATAVSWASASRAQSGA
ncbi:MAG: hypothetical protein BroJett024_16670 [Alphaproteobacteria bacterium]|nr:MAG: hypothetical protein BroJett024_16670 [Alphaproteobacteria bacterium]